MYREKRISLVMPCLNEEQGLPEVARDLPAIVDQVIVVDNNSTDNTAAVARSYGWTVVSETRRGYGRAYKTGLAAATGDVIVTMDGDGTYPRNFIPILLDVMVEEEKWVAPKQNRAPRSREALAAFFDPSILQEARKR